MVRLTDKSPMPYGQYKGIKMANVPPDYLVWLYRNERASLAVKLYIEDNLDVLKNEMDQAKPKNKKVYGKSKRYPKKFM